MNADKLYFFTDKYHCFRIFGTKKTSAGANVLYLTSDQFLVFDSCRSNIAQTFLSVFLVIGETTFEEIHL